MHSLINMLDCVVMGNVRPRASHWSDRRERSLEHRPAIVHQCNIGTATTCQAGLVDSQL